MQTPNTGIQMEYSTDHIFQGDTRRSTINGIMDMLGTRSELEERLKTIQASPVRVVTKEAAEWTYYTNIQKKMKYILNS